MSSTITNYSANIDTTFPIPGADNDTQGFRDNFIAIKNSLETAANEISSVQIVNQNAVYRAVSEPAHSYGTSGDVPGTVYITSSTMYVCYDYYQGTTTNIWSKITLDNSSF